MRIKKKKLKLSLKNKTLNYVCKKYIKNWKSHLQLNKKNKDIISSRLGSTHSWGFFVYWKYQEEKINVFWPNFLIHKINLKKNCWKMYEKKTRNEEAEKCYTNRFLFSFFSLQVLLDYLQYFLVSYSPRVL